MHTARGLGSSRSLSRVLALVCLAGLAASASGQVQWRSGAASPSFDATAVPAMLVQESAKAGHVAVKLTRPIDDAGRATLSGMGLVVLSPLGDSTFMAGLRGDADTAGLSASGWIAGVAPIQTDWKVHPEFRAGLTPSWIVVEKEEDPVVAVYVTLHDDLPAADFAKAVAGPVGGTVVGVMISVNAAVMHVPRSSVMAIAAMDEVLWVEPASPQLEELNSENRALTGANTANSAPYSLNGAGVKVLVFDGGTAMTTHVDFQGRLANIDAAGLSSHATHVSGTIGGAGVAVANNRGMAPGVTLVVAGVNISGVSGWLYSNPCDIELDYGTAYGQGAVIANNSIGTNVSTNGFPCSWEGDYNTTDRVIDSIVRGTSAVTANTPFRIVWAASNERQGSCGNQFNTIGPPAGAKNHLSIGALNANDDSMTTFSGWGPTDDGRMKPDFSAPGCQAGGDGGVTSTSTGSNTAYASLCGTSMAAPTVTGLSSLLLQDWRAQFPAQPDPRNSTLKVLYAQTAVDLGNPGPDYKFGYGSVRIVPAIDLMRTAQFRQETVSQGFDQTYTVTVAPGTPSLALTLAWDDAPGTALVIPSLVNDLDLEVFGPDFVQVFPWTLNPAIPANNAVRTQRNSLDNLEQVRVENPAAGVWHVRVKAFAVPVGPQMFSLVSSAPMTGGVPLPSVSITGALAPVALDPLVPTPVGATIIVQNDTLVAGSARVYYRAGTTGAFSSTIMTNTSGDVWSASLPGFPCGATPQYYYSATGTTVGTVTVPTGGASAPYSAQMGELQTSFSDTMEVAGAWVVGPNTATTGIWERADPQGTTAQPEDDATPTPGVNCYVTGATAGVGVGTFDVDTGYTYLTSPTFSVPSPDATIEYSRWYNNNAGTYADQWLVEISNNNGSTWTTFESLNVGAPAQAGWVRVSKTLAQIGIAPSLQMKLRFKADDTVTPSIVEAAIDDVIVRRWVCEEPGCNGDVNCDFALDGFDVETQERAVGGDLTDYCQPDADFNGDFALDGFDVEAVEIVVGGGPCP